MVDGDASTTTVDGDVVMVKVSRIGWMLGKGSKSSFRGAGYQMTMSQKLAALNKIVCVYELESEENGDWTLKLWEWK